MKLLLLGASALVAQGMAPNSAVVLSGSYGRPMTVGQLKDLRESWAPTAMTTADLFGAFKAMCADGAAEANGLVRSELTLPSDRKIPAAVVSLIGGEGVQIAKWDGDPATLKGRASVIRDRGVLVTGPVSNRNIRQAQCSLSAKTSALDAAALGTAMSQAFGSPAKLVVKEGFADGEWQANLPGRGKVNLAFSAVDLKKPTQLLHISLIEEKNAK